MQHSRILPVEPFSAPLPLPGTFPPAPAVMRILGRFNRDELGAAIEVMVALLDIWDGDPDNEPCGDDEPLEANGDMLDAAFIEWDQLRGVLKRGPNLTGPNEDDEDDDPAEDSDPAEDDDPDAEHDGCEPDTDEEREQMHGDVPMPAVYSLEHNIFNDKRTFLGIANLQSSFIGQDIRSADSGALHTEMNLTRPGVPV